MKRGLKGNSRHEMFVDWVGSNLCPDEKGTESKHNLSDWWQDPSSNLCPDEKGTEEPVSSFSFLRFLSSNLCPDEKGTESLSWYGGKITCLVATYAPMKRGLKVPIRDLAWRHYK